MLLYLNLVENGNEYGDLFRSMYKCRHRNFVQRQDYDAYVHNSIAEYDRYDTPGTYYLVWLDEQREVRGSIRLNSMTRPTMLSEVFPYLVTFEKFPTTDDCWEGTRICVDKDLSAELRTQVKNELVIGTIEFCHHKNVKYHYGMMQNTIFKYVYERSNVKLTYLGPTFKIGGQDCRAAKHPTSQNLLNMLKQLSGINGPIIANIPIQELIAA